MKMHHHNLCGLFVPLLLTPLLSFALFAEECFTDAQPPPPLAAQPFQLSHIEGKGLGYKTGYTSAEAFLTLPNSLENAWIPFLDLRDHIFDDGKFAANAGLGLRYVNQRVWGANVFYDFRQTHRVDYSQVGLGIESLGCDWDFRFNGYLPVGRKQSRQYDYKFAGFKGHHAYLSHRREFAMRGLDAEVGTTLTSYSDLSLYTAIGPYYYADRTRHLVGGKARASLKYLDYVNLEVSGSYDPHFKGIVQGLLSINIPLGNCLPAKKEAPCCYISKAKNWRTRALQPVVRQEIIVKDRKSSHKVARDAQTHKPIDFIFVNNLSTQSDGTFEHPYATLSAAQKGSKPNDKIYVYSGNGGPKGMNSGIVLQDNQALWGSANTHPLNTTAGLFTIPPQTAAMPLIRNINGIMVVDNLSYEGVAVFLANHNEVSGIHIGDSSIGILGQEISDANINNNLFTVSTNVTNGTLPEIVGAIPDAFHQIELDNSTGRLQIIHNQFEPLDSDTVGFNIAILIGDDGTINPKAKSKCVIAHNTFLNSDQALYIINAHNADYTIFHNNFSTPNGVETFGVTLSSSIQGNLTANVGYNTFTDINNALVTQTSNDARAHISFHHNIADETAIVTSGFGVVQIYTYNSSKSTIAIAHNNLNTTTAEISVECSNSSTLNLLVDDNQINSPVSFVGVNAVDVEINDSANFSGIFSHNQTNLSDGYFFSHASTQEGRVTFDSNVATFGLFGLGISRAGSGKLTALVQNNQLHQPSSGIRNETTATGELAVCFAHNTFPEFAIANHSTQAILNLEKHDNSPNLKLKGVINKVKSGICPTSN